MPIARDNARLLPQAALGNEAAVEETRSCALPYDEEEQASGDLRLAECASEVPEPVEGKVKHSLIGEGDHCDSPPSDVQRRCGSRDKQGNQVLLPGLLLLLLHTDKRGCGGDKVVRKEMQAKPRAILRTLHSGITDMNQKGQCTGRLFGCRSGAASPSMISTFYLDKTVKDLVVIDLVCVRGEQGIPDGGGPLVQQR
jgi:hypothetical protein